MTITKEEIEAIRGLATNHMFARPNIGLLRAVVLELLAALDAANARIAELEATNRALDAGLQRANEMLAKYRSQD